MVIGDHAQTGVNVSTYPGVRIGAYSWVNPGVTVSRDVPDCYQLVEREGKRQLVDISARVACPGHVLEARRRVMRWLPTYPVA